MAEVMVGSSKILLTLVELVGTEKIGKIHNQIY